MKKFTLSALIIVLGLTLTGCTHQLSESEVAEKAIAMEQVVQYMDYSAEAEAELKGKQAYGIFFYAEWCSTCRKWEKKLLSSGSELPANMIILKADYDTETELVKSLEVTSQSTLVLFDAAGEVVSKQIDPPIAKVSEFFTELEL